MAKVVVQISVSSVSANGDFRGRVIKGWETFQITVKGEPVTKKRVWTMWLDYPSDITKGDVIEFEGQLGTKVADYETKDGTTGKTVEHSLNQCQWRAISRAVPLPANPAVEVSTDSPF